MTARRSTKPDCPSCGYTMRNGRRCGPCSGGTPTPYGPGGSKPYARWRLGIQRVVRQKLFAADVYDTDLILGAMAWSIYEREELPDDPRVRAVLADHPRPFRTLAMIDAIIAKAVREYNRSAVYLREHAERGAAILAEYHARGVAPPIDYNPLDREALRRATEGQPTGVRVAAPRRRVAPTGLRFETDDDVLAALVEAEDEAAPAARREAR